jgi:hypothetical protein
LLLTYEGHIIEHCETHDLHTPSFAER